MPGLKRKDAAVEAKRGKDANEARSANAGNASKKPRRSDTAPSAPSSSLVAHDVDFPRGGGSNLTPFEHKQVLREVKAETLQKRQEALASRNSRKVDGSNGNLFNEAGEGPSRNILDKKKLNREKKNAQKKKRDVASFTSKSKGKSKAVTGDDGEGEQPARIGALNYKRLTVGTRLLCSVLAVHPLAAVLSLPNQLLGHVPVTNISETLTQRLESAADSDDESETESDEVSGDSGSDSEGSSSRHADKRSHDKTPELRDVLRVGQWVCASVVALHSAESGRNYRGREGGEYEQESRRVELSIDPTVVCEGVSATDLCPGFVLPLTVKSREDHGYLFDTGIVGIGAFVTFKEAHEAASSLHIGQVVMGTVDSLAANKRSVNVLLQSSKIAKAVPEVVPGSSAMLPGNLVNALVTNESTQGLNVKLFGMFDGTVDAVHLPPATSYKIGQRIKVRVLWEVPPQMQDDVAERKFALSAARHVTNLSPRGVELQQKYPVGTIVNATVTSTVDDWGLTCEVRDADGLKAFVHISNVSDDHIAKLPAHNGAYRIGTHHEARVIGHAFTDDVLRLSTQESVLRRAFMRVSEVVVGETIKCTIKAVKPQAIVLDLNGSVDGVVFPNHFADVMLKKPEKKYRVGQAVNARVWQVDPERNRIAMTLKRTLVQSDLAIIGSIQDSRVGVLTHGVVSRIIDGNVGPSAVLLDLYGNLRAYVPISEAFETSTAMPSTLSAEAIKTSFFIGKVVKVRLTRVEYETGRITASIRQASESYQQRLNVDAVQIGESVEGKLAAVHQDVVVLELQPSNVRALLGLNTLAKERNTTVETLRESLTEGEIISGLKVIDKKAERGIVIVGGASSKPKGDSANGTARVRESDLVVGAIVNARVSRKEGNAVTLHVGNLLRCSLHATDCADDYGDQPASSLLPAEGTQVQVSLLNVRGSSSNRRSEVSMRPSRLDQSSASKPRDAEVNSIDEVRVGSKYRGLVRAVAERNGLFVEIGRNVTARVMIAELFDDFVKDWTARFTIGQLVEGKITAVDAGSKKVEMSMRSGKANGKSKSQEDKAREDEPSTISLRSIQEGQKYKAFVKGVAEYGVFVQIEGTNLSGLAHKTQLSDDSRPDDALKAFRVGDQVKAIVLKVDVAKGKLSFGLKPSLFTEEDFVESDNEDEAEDEEDDEEEDDEASDAIIAGVEDEDDDDEDSDAEMDADALLDGASDSDQDMLQVNHGSGSDSDDDEDDDEDVDDSEEDSEAEPASLGAIAPAGDAADESDSDEEAAIAPALSLKGGLSWNANGAHVADDDSNASEASSDEDAGIRSGTKRRRNKKVTQEDLTADLATKMPETSTDFERLLLGSPNSSFLWIQFISFHVQLGNIAKARETAQRALQVIHYREEQEKFNVWIALLNLENTYGDDASLESTFKEACAFNDAQAVHVRLAEILEQSNKMTAAQEQWKRTTKKFGFAPEVWISYHRFLLRHEPSGQEARSMVARSMQSLDKRNHVETIVAYALDEFKLGDVERGRTIFEGLVDSYPKRLDIWLQYIDQEAKLSNAAQVRILYERTLALKQSSKKVKSILKKWLEFEKSKGTAQTQQAVLERARRFVAERDEQQGDAEDGSDADMAPTAALAAESDVGEDDDDDDDDDLDMAEDDEDSDVSDENEDEDEDEEEDEAEEVEDE